MQAESNLIHELPSYGIHGCRMTVKRGGKDENAVLPGVRKDERTQDKYKELFPDCCHLFRTLRSIYCAYSTNYMIFVLHDYNMFNM